MKSLVVFFLACGAMFAQSTGQIQGVIQDPSGAAIAGAQIVATQTDTGAARTVTAGADGTYVLANLPIGPYRIQVNSQGFQSYVQTGVVLQVATNVTVNVTLMLGGVSEQVQVEANAPLVDTERTGIGTVVENQRIVELPLNGRNVSDLIQLAGSAIPAGQGSSGASIPGAQSISVAGGQTYGVAYRLDGAEYSNPYDATSMPFPFPDALQEFKVETSALTAQNGEHSGASINAVTRSGTNSFHGDLFEFLRNGDLNARNFFARSRDSLKRNQFGGTVGGPIKKNKLFFFAGYQGTRVRQDATDSTAFVPTAAMLGGDFTAFASPVCNHGTQLHLPAPFVNNQISASLLNPSAVAIAKQLPSTDDECGKVIFGPRTVYNAYQVLGRVDYQWNEKHSIFVRYMNTAYYQPAAVSLPGGNPLDSTIAGHDQLATSVTLGDTYLLNSTTVNSFRASFNRTASHTLGGEFFSGCDVGVAVYCYVPHETRVSVSGNFTVGGPLSTNAILSPTTYQLGDDVSFVHGAHQFAFGINAYQYRSTTAGNVYSQGTFSFGGTVTGNAMSDFLLGNLSSFTQGGPNILLTRKNYVSAYAQDTWKVTPRFTVNLGLRWEPFIPQTMTNGAIYNFSLAGFQQNVRSTVFANAPPGLTFPGDPGFAGKAGMNHQWNLFAPRVGLAWATPDGKTSIRASYGLAYDFINAQFFASTSLASPWGDLTTIPGPISLSDPWATFPGGNIFPVTFSQDAPFANFGSFIALSPDLNTTSVHQWNLSIQRQFGSNWLVSATYAGSETEHLWGSFQLNPGTIVPSTYPLGTCPKGITTGCNSTGNLNQRRVLYLQNPQEAQYIGYMDQFADGGTASYNGLVLAVQRRLSRGVTLNANYTWSHCVGDQSIGSSAGGAGSGYTQPNNRRADRGNCQSSTLSGLESTDRRHIFNLTVVAAAPQFKSQPLHAIASDWKLAGIYRATSGASLTVTSSTDRQLSGQNNQRLNQINADPLCADPRPSCWINPAAFALPAYGTLGNMAPANIRGPGFFQFDLALSREFRVHEGQTLEIRGEAFNVTNSFRAGSQSNGAPNGLAGITTSMPSATFGQILSALDPRIMQVAMKFVF
jgi:Carboxypeptidase regulatory-like domain